MTSYCEIIKPKRTLNKIENPGPANLSNILKVGTGTTLTIENAGDTVGGIVAQTRTGRKVARFIASNANSGIVFDLDAACANVAHMMALYVYPISPLPSVLHLGVGANQTSPAYSALVSRDTDGTGWTRLYLPIASGSANGRTYAWLWMPNSATLDILVSAAMLYEGSTLETYFDGNAKHCRWEGLQDGSGSVRPRYTRKALPLLGHGEILPLDTDRIGVRLIQGTGIAPIKYTKIEEVGRPGTITIDPQLGERAITVDLYCEAEDREELYEIRRELRDRVQPGDEFELHWTPESNVTYAITAKYIGGLGHGELTGYADQQVSLALEAGDPRWRELAPKTYKLALSKTISNANYLARRKEGEWLAVGSGLPAAANCIYHAPDGYTYIGTRSDGTYAYVYRWDGYSLTQLGKFNGGTPQINAICQTLDGSKLVVVGSFTQQNGAGTFNRFALYTFGSTTWSSIGSGLSAEGYALALGADGVVYVGFGGTTANGVTVNYFCAYNPGAGTFSALKTGAVGAVRAILVRKGRGDVVLAGDFTSASVPDYVTSLNVTRNANGSGTYSGSYKRVVVTALAGSGEREIDGLNLSAVWRLASPGGGSQYSWTYSWTADPDATSYRVYSTDTAGVDPNPSQSGAPVHWLLAETTGTSYTDDGTVPLSAVQWPLNSEGYKNRAGCRSARIGLYAPTEGAYYSLGSVGFNGSVTSLSEDASGAIIAGGSFSEVDGLRVNGVAIYRGNLWLPMGSGVTGNVNGVKALADGSVLVGGVHTAAGGYSDGAKLARYIGSETAGVWLPVDIDLSGVTVYAVSEDPYGDVWVAHSSNGSLTAAAITNLDVSGSWEGAPLIVVTGPGANVLLANYDLLTEVLVRLTLEAGEILTIDPEERTLTSNYRGNVYTALLLGSSLDRFRIRPEQQKLSLLVRATSGASGAILTGRPIHVAGE